MATIPDLAPTGTLTFHAALEQAAALARHALDPALHERLACAAALVKDGAVFHAADEAWLVASTSKPNYEYRINGHGCQCEDAVYRGQDRCKHVLAVLLARKALQLMRAPQTAPGVAGLERVRELPAPPSPPAETAAVPSPPAPVLASVPEMPFSVTLKGTIDGQDALLTARGLTAAEFTSNLAAIRGLLDPVPAPSRAQPPAQGQPSQATAPTPQCPTHGAMKQSTKGKGWYCPHKNDDDTWCKSKAR